MRIQVVDVTEPITQSGKNNKQFQLIEVSYLSNGKPYSKKLTSYSDAYKAFAGAMPEQVFDVELEKNGIYTEWKNPKAVEGEPEAKVSAPKSASTSKATPKVQKASAVADPRETPEERKARQELIVRQSSLTNAIEYAKMQGSFRDPNVHGGFVYSEDKIIELAKKFRDFVYANQEVTVSSTDTVE